MRVFGLKKKNPQPTYLKITENPSDFVPKDQRKYDLVMLGSTGFTGKLLVKYLAQNYKNLNWAIAGRSKSRLESVRTDISKLNEQLKDLPILIADTSKPEELKEVIRNTRVVVSTVGPYAKYGSNVVALCAQYGTHYGDITGEVAWVRDMIQEYDNIAKKTGAVIINCCGCDSIPWDMLSFKLAQSLKQDHDQGMKIVQHFDHMQGGFSGGTFATLCHSIENPPQKSSLGYDPLKKKLGVNEKYSNKFKAVIQRFLGYNSVIGRFVGMWALADGNSCIVKRSNYLLNYSDDLTYKEHFVYNSFIEGFNTQVGFILMGVFISNPILMKLFGKKLFPQPGQGPSQKQMDNGYLTLRSIAVGTKDTTIAGMIKFPNDPGYIDTARMLAETGLSLVFNEEQLKGKGGFQTSASGLGDILVGRLVSSGTEIEIMDLEKLQDSNKKQQ